MMEKTLQLWNWIWWRNRNGLLFLLGSIVLLQLVYWLGLVPMPDWAVQTVTGALIPITILLSLAIFTFGSELDFASGRTAFPTRLFQLPVGSFRVAIIPVLGMLIAIALCWMPAIAVILHSASEGFTREGTGNTPFLAIFLLPWLVISALGCWLQTIAWWPFRSAWHRVFFVAFMVVAVVGLLIWCIDLMQARSYLIPRFVLAGMAVTGVVGAILSVIKARQLSWRSEVAGRAATSDASGSTDSFPSLAKVSDAEFDSTQDALAWRQWHRIYKVPFMLTLLFMAPIAFAVVWVPLQLHFALNEATEITPKIEALSVTLSLLRASTPLVLLFPPFLLLLASPSFGKSSYWNREFAIGSYLAGLPVSDDQFVSSRILGVAKTSFAIWLCAFLVVVLWALPHSMRAPLEEVAVMTGNRWASYVALGILATLYLALVIPWPGLAVGMYGRGKLGTVILVLILILSAFVISVGFQIIERALAEVAGINLEEFLTNWMSTILASLLFAKLLLLAYAIIVALNRKLMDAWQIYQKGIFLSLVCLTVTTLFVFLLRQDPSTGNTVLRNIAMVVLLLFPCSSLLFARIAFDANRHR